MKTCSKALEQHRALGVPDSVTDIMRWKYGKLIENLSNALQIALGLELRDSGRIDKLARLEGVQLP